MAKTNYTKVEEALAEGMLKMEVNKLLNEADENAAKREKSLEAKNVDPIILRRLAKIDKELQLLEKNGKNPYIKLQIDKEEIKRYLNEPSTLTPEDLEKIKQIKEKIADYKTALEYKEKTSEDEFIENQRKDQKTKRFNVNKKWIPLQ